MNLFCDMHIHSCLSPCGDSLMTPNNITGMAFLKGLDVIAVTDHNSALNLPAVLEAASAVGLCLLPGIEATTSEEAHILCYFADIEAALEFGAELRLHLPDIANRPEYFGEQLIMNGQDEVTGIEDKLLISALDLPLSRLTALCGRYGGVCVPAHINRGANGILNALGFIPPDSGFKSVEVNAASEMPPGDFSAYRILRSSDAHRLEDILEAIQTIDAEEKSASAVLNSLRRAL